MAQNRGGPFLILAILLGLAAAGVVWFYLNQQSAANVTSRQTRPVVVAATDQPFGTKLERNMLKVVNYPKDSVPGNAYSSLDSVVGQTTKIFLASKEPVLASKLSTIGGGLSMMVRPNMRASSVTVNLVSSVSGFVVPGDKVDVLVTIDQTAQQQIATTKTILQNIEVLAAGVKTEQRDQQDKPNTDLQTITLLVDPPAAERMKLADRSVGGGRNKLITVFSNKGGVGTTSTSVNLSVALARVTGKEVGLADLDLQAGDVSIFMRCRQ